MEAHYTMYRTQKEKQFTTLFSTHSTTRAWQQCVTQCVHPWRHAVRGRHDTMPDIVHNTTVCVGSTPWTFCPDQIRTKAVFCNSSGASKNIRVIDWPLASGLRASDPRMLIRHFLQNQILLKKRGSVEGWDVRVLGTPGHRRQHCRRLIEEL